MAWSGVLGSPGLIAVVTGGGSGIGRALCVELASRGARHVVVVDIDGPAATVVAGNLHSLGAAEPCSAAALDVGDSEAVASLVARIESEIGPIGLWCSNAGVHRGHGIGEPADWRASLDVNLSGHVNAARHLMPRMVRRRAGAFVVTASAAGLLTDLRCAPYSASKHAAVAFAEWLAIVYGGDGVQVACACPEGVKTGMTRSDSAEVGGDFLAPEDVAKAILSGLVEGRFLILPHPRVAEFERRRADDRERWLRGMRRAHAPANPS